MSVGEIIGLVAGVIVGGAFLLAGFTKLQAGPGWPRQAADMGVARPIALPVPWVELAVGALTVVGILSPWPAVAAAALLVAFTVLIVLRLREGSRPPCACFGARFDRPLGVGHIVRNAVLFALAVVSVVLR